MQTNHVQSPTRLLLGIDWGTSNRRAYLVDAHGNCLASHADDQGMLAVRPHFASSIETLIATMKVPADVPVVASGMVGSAQGWQEVPYLDTSTPLSSLPRHLAQAAPVAGGHQCHIVPGYCQRTDGIDVMRGEETQLLGALTLGHRDGWVILPGTHSKWVLLRDGAIIRFSTFMTGELFAMVGTQGTLAPLMADGDADDEQAFASGLDEARRRAPLSNALFQVRARVVTGAMPASQARSFVSGLLIGTEFVAAASLLDDPHMRVAAIASPALLQRYAVAAGHLGMTLDAFDPDRVYCAALTRFIDQGYR